MIRTRKNRVSGQATPARTPKRLTPSIRLDAVHPQDYMKYDLRFACEDCSHFDAVSVRCTMGYDASKHLRAEQLRTYELCGRIAMCRAIEID